MDYWLHILNLLAIFAILATSLDLLVGHTGLLSVAHAAFFGIGAYVTALLATNYGIGFGVTLIISVLSGAVASLLVSQPSMRLHGVYFVIATFAFQMIVFSILNNWTLLTHGPLGIYGIPSPSILGIRLDTPLHFLPLSVTMCAITCVILHRVIHCPFGRVLHAIREDDITTQSYGKPTVQFKILAFALSAAFAALAGCLYAYYVSYVGPGSFTVMDSVLILAMVIIGGSGNIWGPLIGAAALIVLPEILRFVGFPSSVAANLRQIFYGATLVACMIWRSQGLIGTYSFKSALRYK